MDVPSNSSAAQANQSAPVGTVVMFAGATAPDGWMKCDGSALPRASYHTLYGIIGTGYGGGDGITTFNLPNMTGKFPQGNGTVGATGGSATHAHSSATGLAGAGTPVATASGGLTLYSAFAHAHSISSDGTLPPFVNLLFIIKV